MFRVKFSDSSWMDAPQVEHGIQTVIIEVGTDDEQKSYCIHKNLICAASEFFQGAFNTSFKEAQDNKLILSEEVPMVFEVLHHWLYTSQICDTKDYTKGCMSYDVFWLKVFQMGDRLLIPAMQVVAYEKFKSILPASEPIVPSTTFVELLFGSNESCRALQTYLIQHTAFWLTNDTTDGKAWIQALSADDYFGREVAISMIKCKHGTTEDKNHPSIQPKFASRHGFDIQKAREEANSRNKKFEADTKDSSTLQTASKLNNAGRLQNSRLAETSNLAGSQSQNKQIRPLSSQPFSQAANSSVFSFSDPLTPNQRSTPLNFSGGSDLFKGSW